MGAWAKLTHGGPGSFWEPGPTRNRAAVKSTGRAGRNLPAAILVGVLTGGLALVAILVSPITFLLLAAVIALYAEYEMAGAFARAGIHLTLPPLWIGSIGLFICAYLLGSEGMWAALIVTLIACCIWRLLGGVSLHAVRDVVASSFVAVYLPFMAGFAAMMANHNYYPLPILFWILATISNDIGGYAAGVLKGKHRLAPSTSPSKSWEGFFGSVAMCSVTLLICFIFTPIPWWWALILGPATAVLATAGDLGESIIKRDLKLKDMGAILPGHGGAMDRLDSLLITAPMFFIAFYFIF